MPLLQGGCCHGGGVEGRGHGPRCLCDHSCPDNLPSVNKVLSSRRTQRTSPKSPHSNPHLPNVAANVCATSWAHAPRRKRGKRQHPTPATCQART